MSDITTGLIVRFKFDETSGATATNSGSLGAAANGTWNSAPTYGAGKIGGAASSSGGNYIGTGTFDAGNDYSVFLWIKTLATDTPILFTNSVGDISLQISPAGNLVFTNSLDNGDDSTTINNNQWHHVGLTNLHGSGGGQLIAYLNGASVGNIGADDEHVDGGSIFLNSITAAVWGDDLRIYNRLLSAQDVAALYAYTGAATALYPRLKPRLGNLDPLVTTDAATWGQFPRTLQ